VRFVNADPARPEVVALGSATEHLITTEACALLIYNTLGALMAAAGGGPLAGAVLLPLIMPAVVTALGAQAAPAPPGVLAQQAAAVAMAAGMATGAPSSTCAPFTAAIAALASKTLDVSGLFPSVGVPRSDDG
jgi:hypothetical protein